MATTLLLSQTFLPLQAVRLGRLITNVDYPHQDFHDPPASNPPKQLMTRRDAYSGTSQESTKSGFSSTLLSLMSLGFSKRAQQEVHISTERVQTYLLEQPRDWFKAATGLDETRKWLETAFDQGDDVFLIVGYHTVGDAKITQKTAQSREQGGQIDLPAGLTLAAAGMMAPMSKFVEVKLDGGRQEIGGATEQYCAPGEQVCGLQYRKLSHRFFSSSVEGAKLSKAPQWNSFSRMRHAADEDEGDTDEDEDEDEDMVEVDMQEDGELDGEGTWDQETTSDGDILILRA